MAEPLLINLLPYRPVATGLSRYSERLLSGWQEATGLALPPQLRLRVDGMAELGRDGNLAPEQHSRRMRWLQANALVQHAVPVARLVREANPAVIYSPYTDRLLAVRDRPQIITCHDLIPLHCPNSRRAYWRSRLWLPRHLQGATMVIAISRAVADLLIADGLPSERIAVIPNGVEPVSDPIHAPASEDVLLLARHAPNKNVALALEGFARLLELEPRWMGRLRIVGGAGPHSRALRALADRLGVSARVDWIAHLSPQALEHCWRSSFCLLSTSRMEGFDYPLFEAQARGLPTLASRIPVHEELHGESALLFDLDDGGVSLATVWQRLARDPSLWLQLSQTGLIHARNYSLKRQLQGLVQVIDQVAARGRWC